MTDPGAEVRPTAIDDGGPVEAPETDDGSARRRRWLVLTGQVLVSVAAIAYLVSRVGHRDAQLIGDRIRDLHWSSAGPLALIVAGTGSLSIVASGWRIQAVAARRGTVLTLRSAVYLNCISLLAAVFMPLGLVGDGLRALLLVRRHQTTVSDSIGIVVTDRVAGLAASCAIAVVGLLVAPSVPGAEDAEHLLRAATVAISLGVGVVILLAAWMHRATGDGWRARFARFGVIDLRALRSPVVLASAGVGQLLEVVSAIALVRLFGFHRPPAGDIAVVSSFLPILEALPASFIGIGAREGALEYVLVQAGEPRGSGLVVGATGLVVRLVVIGLALLVTQLPRGSVSRDR